MTGRSGCFVAYLRGFLFVSLLLRHRSFAFGNTPRTAPGSRPGRRVAARERVRVQCSVDGRSAQPPAPRLLPFRRSGPRIPPPELKARQTGCWSPSRRCPTSAWGEGRESVAITPVRAAKQTSTRRRWAGCWRAHGHRHAHGVESMNVQGFVNPMSRPRYDELG